MVILPGSPSRWKRQDSTGDLITESIKFGKDSLLYNFIWLNIKGQDISCSNNIYVSILVGFDV